MFERLRAAIAAALEAATPPADLRDLSGQMRQALVELRAGVSRMRDDLAATARQLEVERQARDDAARRGRLAADIGDRETVRVAERFAARHGERVGVLEQKQTAQGAELALAERELADMTAQFQALERQRAGGAGAGAEANRERAWRDITAAGGARPETDVEGDLGRNRADRAAREAAAEEQLRELKKRMGKSP